MMIALTTRYLGLELDHPIVPGASPLADELDTVLRLEDAGASAIVMRSIFEEQIELEQMAAHRHIDVDLGPEAGRAFVDSPAFALGLDSYLEQIRRIRERTRLGVIGSLNGTTPGGWLEYARRIEQAGAHALELNLYSIAADDQRSATQIEARQIAIVRSVTSSVSLPVGVKLSPFYSALPSFVSALAAAGAQAAVVFNRLYQADIDPERLEAQRTLRLSSPDELLLRLRWLAILSAQPRITARGAPFELAASGGVHEPIHVIKALMAGATVVQAVSSLLIHGPSHLRGLVEGLRHFLEDHEYPSLDALRGNMNLARTPNPSVYERADYIHLLSSWHGRVG
jgi:dihydroorotate dehydrogenase (fumarate)